MNMASAVHQRQKSNRLAIVDGAVHELDRAIAYVDQAYNAAATGQTFDYNAASMRVDNALLAVNSALTSLRAAGVQGLGNIGFIPPLGPAFSMPGGGGGFSMMTPQGMARPGVPTSVAQRSLAPQLGAMRARLYGARQLLTRMRTHLAAEQFSAVNPIHGLGALGVVPNIPGPPGPAMTFAPKPAGVPAPVPPGPLNITLPTKPLHPLQQPAATAASAFQLPLKWQRPPDLFPGQKVVEYAIAIAGFAHGYKRNNNSFMWGLAWMLPGLLGLIPGSIGMVVAYNQGFGKAPHSPQPHTAKRGHQPAEDEDTENEK